MDISKKVNRKYKASMFTALFSDEEKAIELYNAIGRNDYPLDAKIEINTLDDILYLDRINDISFVIDDKLVVLVEQQSSVNLNMPLRFLLYINKIYEKIIAANELNVYRRSLLKIPRPEFICLYNGKESFPDEKVLRLSDSYKQTEEDRQIDLELTVKVININKSKNEDIVKESKTLSEYIIFTDRIRVNLENGMPLEKAIDETVKYCIENKILEEFLKQYSSEVKGMLATEFDMEKALQAIRLDGYEQGIEEGFEEGFEEGIEKGIEEGFEKGIEKGIEKKETDIVLKLLKQDFSDNDIISITGISTAKLLYFKALLNN